MGAPMRSGKAPARRPGMVGFAYVLLLVAVAVLGVAAAAALQLGAQWGRRDAEQALLMVGGEFERALHSYAGVPLAVNGRNMAGFAARGPRTLDELLKDPRVLGMRRHLRQLYADPFTGRSQWGLLRDPSGYIVGVYSLAEGRPIKQRGFTARWAHFEDAPSYRAWVFGLPMAQALALQNLGRPAGSVLSRP